MRLLFLFVLLVNVIFVGWQVSQSEDELVLNKDDAKFSSIEMLSETGQATKISTEKLADASVKTGSRADLGKRSEKQGKQAPTPTPVASVPSDVETCYTLGPFRDLDKLREFTRAIKDYVVTASFRSREEQEQSMFWVYLEPESSAIKAKVLGQKLQDKQIKDFYVISSGAEKNGVSLGHFKEKDRANAHAESINKLGFKPKIEPVFKTYTIYWLDYQVSAGTVIPQKVFATHLTKKINRLDRVCS